MSPREWPIAGAAIAFGIVLGIAAWRIMPHVIPPAFPTPATPQAQLSFDREQAFSDFHMRMLGLPTVHTYPQPHLEGRK